MKRLKILGWSSALCLSVMTLSAQETSEVEQLKKQLQQMKADFERVQNEQRLQIEALTRKLEELSEQPAKNESPAASSSSNSSIAGTPSWRPSDPVRIGRGSVFMDIGLVGTLAAGGSTADDIEEGLQPGGHDPNQNGFTLQGVEASFSGAVDPYFRGNANVLFSVDSRGESFLELEEGWLESTSLPGNLQLRAGQILTEFGRQNTQHPHSWSFVDSPLVNARLLGPDGLRNPGARLSWLAPTPFYSEFFVTLQNSHGATVSSFRSAGHSHGGEEEKEIPLGFRHPDNDRGVNNLDDLLITPRATVSFDLTDTQTLLVGASAAFGPNSSGDTGDTVTQIYGTDLTWKWKSAQHQAGFPFVTWQTEGLFRRYDVGEFDWSGEFPAVDDDGNGFTDAGILLDSATGAPPLMSQETLTDYGFYTQLSYGFRKGWVAGLRFDYVAGTRGDYETMPLIISDNAGGGKPVGIDPLRARRWRVSPNLTWFPTEFSKIRLQYNYDDRQLFGTDHSVWLQFEFVLGAHAAHKF